MGEGNGNGFKPVEIDVTNDVAFRTGVVQYFQLLSDRTACLPAIKATVDKHESYVKFGKWLGIPSLFASHVSFKAALSWLAKW